MADSSAAAVIEADALVIRIAVAHLPLIVEGGWAAGVRDQKYQVTDAATFAREVCTELNREREDGTTPIHILFDRAINAAIEQGAEGITEART